MNSADFHAILQWVVGSVITAALLYGAAKARSAVKLMGQLLTMVQQFTEHVLPHFVQPTAEEVMAGVEDNTLPTRVKRQEVQLSTHLVTEEKAAEAAAQDRRVLDRRLEHIEARLPS